VGKYGGLHIEFYWDQALESPPGDHFGPPSKKLKPEASANRSTLWVVKSIVEKCASATSAKSATAAKSGTTTNTIFLPSGDQLGNNSDMLLLVICLRFLPATSMT
jgi:hypothetical protein